jgi:hypothetical protein
MRLIIIYNPSVTKITTAGVGDVKTPCGAITQRDHTGKQCKLGFR